MRFVTRVEIQDLDQRAIQEFGIPASELMQNAGKGAAAYLKEILAKDAPHKSVLVLWGKGNNGGDGFVAARYLAEWGTPVSILLFAPSSALSSESLSNFIRA